MAVIKNMEKWKKEVEKALDSVFETKRISGAIEQELTLFGKKTTFTLYDPILVSEERKKIDEDYAKVYITTSMSGAISIFDGNDFIEFIPVEKKINALCRMIKAVTLALQNNEQKNRMLILENLKIKKVGKYGKGL